MSKIKQVSTYSFDELEDDAKERAREWYRECTADDSFWSENVIEDAATCADILGINLRTRSVALMNDSTRYEPAIYWSGFWSQGDGACFEGVYSYALGSAQKICEHAPEDAELHRIASSLQSIQRRYFYSIGATATHRGHYQHSGCMSVDVESTLNLNVSKDDEDEIRQELRSFADWIYRQLEREYEWTNADEQVDDSIRTNEYKFTEDGSRSIVV